MSLTVIIVGLLVGIGGVNVAAILLSIDTLYWLLGFSLWMVLVLILSKVLCSKVESWMERNIYSKRF